MVEESVNFPEIEEKWQKKWEENKIFQVSKSDKEKFFLLEMFPYPSGSGLHMGHALNYVIGDILSRFKRMKGFNVLYPMGYDALGLPAENAAIKDGTHPKEYTDRSIKNFMKQQNMLGLSYDWSRLINTSSSDYYKWDQWIFLQMLKEGLAYQKEAAVNWCPSCKTVLANEQAQTGYCDRCKSKVEVKHLKQWFLKITDYADELYDMIDDLDWPQRTKAMQKNWIGKSYGTEIKFNVNGQDWSIFTTRPDTLFGVTFMVISAQHSKLMDLVTKEQKPKVEEFLKKISSVSQKSMKEEEALNKEGVFTGSYAVNPLTDEKIPIYAGNFVVADYGSGMVMAVPAHDQRDFDFAMKYDLPIKFVVDPVDYEIYSRKDSQGEEQYNEAYTGNGKLINSGDFDGLDNHQAKEEITKKLQDKEIGKKVTQFKLRDWLISRQRYWGTPIPIIHCEKCGAVPVLEEDLPVELPREVDFQAGGNPLETNEKWINVKCPKCGQDAVRETDTMDTFVNSSWYFLRYTDSGNENEIFDKEKANYWCPIDQYIGGAEHACMHLIYFRFYTKFLRDIGLLNFDEPAKKLFHQGMLHGEDGEKMSKSRGNTIDPIGTIEECGADSLRLALMSFASPDKDTQWDTKIFQGSYKFLNKVENYFNEVKISKKADAKTESKLNKVIKEVTKQIDEFKYNLAIIKVRELFNSLPKETSKDVLEKSLKLLHPFCPHITEELWEKIGNTGFISLEEWPKIDTGKIDEKFEKQEQANENLASDIKNVVGLVKGKQNKEVSKAYVYVLPNELEFYALDEVKKKANIEVEIYAVNNKNKYDPEGKSKKAKPGKPAIYLE
jgi:leucyl-tRNA synthetase